MAQPTIEELLARIERLESQLNAAPTGPTGREPAEPGPCPAAPDPRSAGMTRRGMVTAAAARYAVYDSVA